MTDQPNLILVGNELPESVEQRPCSFQYRRPTRSAARFVDSPTLDSVVSFGRQRQWAPWDEIFRQPYQGEGSLNGLRTSSTGGGSMFSDSTKVMECFFCLHRF